MFSKLLILTASLSLILSYSGAQSTIREEFKLMTSLGNVLVGELEYPNQEGKFPAAILIWGSGPHSRDQLISGTPLFRQLADTLIAEGLLVLRMDKRGQGESTGNFKSEDNYTTRDLADDVSIAYDYLNAHPRVDTNKMGLIGHSEGAIIASILGAEESTIDWLILFGPSAVSGREIELEQGHWQRERLGFAPEVSAAVGKVWEQYIEFITAGYQNDSVYYDIGKRFLLAHGMEEDDERITKAFIDQLLDAYKTPWYQYFYATDNSIFLEKIRIPILGVFGGADQQTSVGLHLLPFYRAMQKANNKRYRIVVLADEDHFFFRYQGNRVDQHVYGKMQLSGVFLKSIKDWLRGEGITKGQ